MSRPSCVRESRGGISLFSSILLVGILSLSLILHQVCSLRIFQSELAQALSWQCDANLALYDQELSIRYGLWGLREEAVHLRCFDRLMRQAEQTPLLLPSKVQAQAEAIEPLRDVQRAREQICAYMRVRAPVQVIDDYARRSRKHLDILQEAQKIQPKVEESHRDWERTKGEIEGLDPQEEELREQLEPLLDFLRVEKEEEGQAFFLQLQQYLGHLSQLLSTAKIPIYDQLIVNEYCMGFFSHAASRYGEKGTEGQTWGFHDLSQRKTKTPYELEYIITSISDKDLAALTVRMLVTGIRLLQHYASIFTDPVRKAGYFAAGTAISGAIAVLTVGTLLIPPAVIAHILMLAAAWFRAVQDVHRLLRGEAVDLQPGKSTAPLYYRDFLRVFLLAVPEEGKVLRAVTCIEDNLSASFYTGASITATAQVGPWLPPVQLGRKETYALLQKKEVDQHGD